MERGKAYDEAAKIYDESRPSYPDPVIDWVIEKTRVEKKDLLLEIGAGTGQATLKFAQRGFRVHCIEVGKSMAEILRRKARGFDISVEVNSFEEWIPPQGFKTPFIFSATAFHWLDQNLKYNKCYELLEDKGHLVLLWNDSPDIGIREVKEAYDLLWEFYPGKKKVEKLPSETDGKRKMEIEKSGFFQLVNSFHYRWKQKISREEFLKGFFSQSSYLALEESKKAKITKPIMDLFSQLDEVIETDWDTNAYIAEKIKNL